MSKPSPSEEQRAIAEYYRRKEAAQAKELDEHLAAGKPIGTFSPRTLID